jgi:hypothetical protein
MSTVGVGCVKKAAMVEHVMAHVICPLQDLGANMTIIQRSLSCGRADH